MTIGASDLLFPASFRGIPFLIKGAETPFGAKTVDHDYPNSDLRYTENLGKNPKVFSVTGILSGPLYIINRDALIDALDDGSIGILIHPFYGIQEVVAKPGLAKEAITELGMVTLEMVFSVSVRPTNPAASSSIESQMISKVEELDSEIKKSLTNIFKISSSFPNNFSFAQAKFNNVNAEFDGFKKLFGSSANFNDLSAQQKSFTDSLPTNLRAPSDMATSLSDLFGVANNASDDPKETASAFTQLFEFGKADNFIPKTNRQDVEKSNNNSVTNYAFNAYTLLYAYLNYSQASFDDDVELEAVAAKLELQYQKIINGTVTDAQPLNVIDVLSSDTLDRLEAARNLARQKFDDDAINVAKITQIAVNEMPASIISYLYYETTDETDQIIALNDLKNISFVSGTLNVRTSAGAAA